MTVTNVIGFNCGTDMLPKGYYGRKSRMGSGNVKSLQSLGYILHYCLHAKTVSERNQQQLPVFMKLYIHAQTNKSRLDSNSIMLFVKKRRESTCKHVGSTIISAKLSMIITLYLPKDH